MRKNYHIHTYSKEESELARRVLNKYGVYYDVDRLIVGYEGLVFKCTKKVWKKIKEELNLKIDNVFARIKKEEEA